ncbi:hypothetical protein [Neptunicoccus cionae]|uniref:Uncharacterized protein n=1 Tax=Neptunicoccus cionae TaxID=2035344 RepID=A0A916QYS5_9RHOB|nr:hypothetical protein [Amylibacter cionae]GGA21823.1 hypothetical protein GCM10011498_23190 [Amylibacter cionae]
MPRRPEGCADAAHMFLTGGYKLARRARRALCALLLVGLAPAAHAFDAATCTTPAQSFADLENALSAEGWSVVEKQTKPVIEALAWIGMPQYFAGDSGGRSQAYVLDLKRAAAKGYFRKKDLTNAKTRILTRKAGRQTELLLVSWLKTSLMQIQVTCDFALSEASTAPLRTEHTALTYDKGYARIPTEYGADRTAMHHSQLVFLDRETLKSSLNINIPASAILSTSLSYPAKDHKP